MKSITLNNTEHIPLNHPNISELINQFFNTKHFIITYKHLINNSIEHYKPQWIEHYPKNTSISVNIKNITLWPEKIKDNSIIHIQYLIELVSNNDIDENYFKKLSTQFIKKTIQVFVLEYIDNYILQNNNKPPITNNLKNLIDITFQEFFFILNVLHKQNYPYTKAFKFIVKQLDINDDNVKNFIKNLVKIYWKNKSCDL